MRTRFPLAFAVLGLLVAVPAHALKTKEAITPKNIQEQGFTFSARKKEDGMVTVRVTRDPAKARWTGRYAMLEVRSEKGLLAKCELAPGDDRKLITYRFNLAPENFRKSYFTVAEVQRGTLLPGGGTSYEFHLADFSDSTPLR